MYKKLLTLFLVAALLPFLAFAQKSKDENSIDEQLFKGLKWRNVGPAFTSGRIADFAVNPNNHAEYYVAVASGHIWKTTNAGTTFEPIFDNYGSYSIGCITIDPSNTSIIWTGTGENNHQRALGYGDGVYKSMDGGKSWKNMGLKDSRQIGKIIVDPRNSNVVFAAAEGSVWGPGGERGLYKTTDGGKTWNKVLNISENTGINNLVNDPRNPDYLYATSEQRRRHDFSKIGGGPESKFFRSFDGGTSWDTIMTGLPSANIGGMGLDISPVNPDVLYLIVEAAENQSGFFRSTNRGSSWEKMSDHSAQGQYYNEIYCDPKDVNKIYSTETVSHVTVDGGKTWTPLGLKDRHVDDHAMWIDPNYTQHFMIGGDGGVYETYDGGVTYDFKENLPVTQFYRVFVDNASPFYYIWGGTQDNNSMGGPSQTLSSDGIVNSDWILTNGGDGFWSAVDPGNPNIVYAESQYGGMVRYDKLSGETVDIRPEPKKGELTYKWYWDTPLFISSHSNTRLYCAANKVFRSDDRGNSWQVISPDLSTGTDRNSFPVMGKFWSIDAVAKDMSTSLWGLVVSLAESPIKENLLYAGTDDGLIQVTEDGKNWTKINEFPGVPEYTFVADILPSKFDANIVYAAFDNTKRDDFKPYIFISKDKGKSWTSIANNLPVNGTVHSIEQDFVNPDLLFAGTEFGIYFTTNAGKNWYKLGSGLPTISVRDIAIQKRENDLVIATFGRGFYILDNYSPLRNINKEFTDKEAALLPVKDALTYIPSMGRYGQGANYFKAPNPDFGAVFTYYLKEVPKTLKQSRQEKEKDLFKDGKQVPQPTDADLLKEKAELNPYLVFTVMDESGTIVRKITKSSDKGINRVVWDLRYQSYSPIDAKEFNPVSPSNGSTLVMPGKYKVKMSLVTRDGIKDLAEAVDFNVVPLKNSTLPADDVAALVTFQKKAGKLERVIRGTDKYLNELINKMVVIKQTLANTPEAPFELLIKAEKINNDLQNILLKFERKSAKPSAEENEPSNVTFLERLNILLYTHYRSTSAITENEKVAYEVLSSEIAPVLDQLKRMYNDEIKPLESDLEKYNAPWTPGRVPELNLE
ncbi:MAG TPA: glycosyl hydrolase [Ignavibacteriaceae bacterium]|nr:glycosyl hydrolase [Ignavibacteriaceae bacterium]